MNERIRELKEAAMEVTFSSPSTGREQKQLNVDKFVELIVRECAGLDFRHKVGMTVQQDYDTSCVILEHFGLKL